MITAVWATDLHLDWVSPAQRRQFYDTVLAQGPGAVLLGGDIGEGPSTADWLREIAAEIPCPVYFVLGNHDFYGDSIQNVRRRIAAVAADCPRLGYLPEAGIVELAPATGLVGHEGWGDARLGNFGASKVFLPDFITIRDLIEVYHDREAMRRRLQALGDEAAAHLGAVLPEALERYPRVVVLTHVPPFREATWHDGRLSDDDWLPYFSCQALGDVLREAARRRPDRQLLVLCGHTHGRGDVPIAANLRVITGGEELHRPQVEQVFSFA